MRKWGAFEVGVEYCRNMAWRKGEVRWVMQRLKKIGEGFVDTLKGDEGWRFVDSVVKEHVLVLLVLGLGLCWA